MTNNLNYTLALAKRVKASGAKLLLDIHYSDTWADPSHQTKPAAWAKLPFPALVKKVRDYTCQVMVRFRDAGLTPDYVQLGNEITNGFLWPDGRVEFSRAPEPAAWDRLGALLRAAYAGLDAAFPGGGRPVTILHIESPNQRARAVWFCRRATEEHVPFDVIGMSYYPHWHGGLKSLKGTLTVLANTFQKPIVVAETAYPWTDDERWSKKQNMDWPISPAGQREFLRDVLGVVKGLPHNLGVGVIYWHPESIPVKGLHVWLGGSCALFDKHGDVLPAASFAQPPP